MSNKYSIIDIFLCTVAPPIKTKRGRKPKVDDEAPENYHEFVVWFLQKNNAIINNYCRRRLIPNRYTIEDMRAYMQERMLDILHKRAAKNKAIEEPKVYFRKLIDFWCIEYQRMYGYVYSLPKRPRCPDAEEEIGQYGFHYFVSDSADSESSSSMDSIPQLGYIDTNLTITNFDHDYKEIGQNPDEFSQAWNSLMKMAIPEDRDVLTCIFRYNLTVSQVSKHLEIAISTAYQRRDRGIRAISGTLASFVDLDNDMHQVLDDVSELSDDKIDITRFFRD
jgi:hypothetical protein